MDKEAFLHQLESSVAKNDKKLFAKTIYELPADVIVGFTKEEFSRIIYISHQFSSQKMDRLCNSLEIKGSSFLKNALKGINEINSCVLSKFYYSLFISLYETNYEKIKCALGNNAAACFKLSEMGIDRRENLETSIRLYDNLREMLPKNSAYYASILINEYSAIQKLDEMGIDNREILEIAINLYRDASEKFSKKSENYACMLMKEGNTRLKLAEMEIDNRENLETAICLYSNIRNIFPKKSEYYSCTLINESSARLKLAEIDVNSRENLETSIHLCVNARETFLKTNEEYGYILISESSARLKLAEIDVNSRENLETSVRLCSNAREIFPKKSTYYTSALIKEFYARLKLAEMCIDSKENLEISICLCGTAQNIFSKTSEDYAQCLEAECVARLKLAELGVNSRENSETTIHLCDNAKETFPKNSAYYASMLASEGNARKMLAEIGIDSRKNLETAIHLYSVSREIFPKENEGYVVGLINEADAKTRLAYIGVDSKENLEAAVHLYSEAKRNHPSRNVIYALILLNEGVTKAKLADTGVNRRENLEAAIDLYNEAKSIFSKKSINYGCTLMNEISVRYSLAEIDIDSKENLETAIYLSTEAKKLLPKTSADYARTLVGESIIRQKLADMNMESKKNLEIAVFLYDEAKRIFPKKSVDYAQALMNEGSTRAKLAERNIDSKRNLDIAKELYFESISVLEGSDNAWTYYQVLLNLGLLLKINFYTTGQKIYLEDWERNLGNIEEKITDRDIIYKELLMARIHEIRANLLEFEGRLGINRASREYDKAYELSKYPFYKFMDEFCQARIDTISFCQLVFNWKKIEKEYIFLDYYDYAVFECHLENALESTINEEDELKLAVEKLKEIRGRTQIKIIKDRVSAYIHLLQALIDCFNNDSYKEAAENVKEGCKIFREYGDKQGQQMCEIFHNAVLKRENPDAWQEIIRNREFSSNFYSLLCEYSDRKRANLEYYRFGQTHEIMGAVSKDVKQIKEISMRTENKIDELQNQIRSGFTEIKDKIEEGFEGTAAELRQIKRKIDNIEQDLDNLVWISNDVSGKEGEYIREFASQMLELMKNGDYEALKRFSEKIVQNSSSIEEIIEAAKIPEKEKAEAKSKLADLEKIPGILKEKMKSFSADVTKDVIVTLTAEKIVTLLTPVLSTAAFGVPVPSKVVEMLLEAMKGS